MKIKIIDRRGQIIDHDDSLPIPEGATVRTSMLLMDSADEVQHAIASSRSSSVRVTDAFGRTAGSRPGYCFAETDKSQTQLRDQAYSEMVSRNESAWKTPSTPAVISNTSPATYLPDTTPDKRKLSDSARAWEDMVRRQENAWRSA